MKISIRVIITVVFAVTLMFIGVNTATASCEASGIVVCDANSNGQVDAEDTPLENVEVNVQIMIDFWAPFLTTTDANGSFLTVIKDFAASYTETLNEATLPEDFTYVQPASGAILFTTQDFPDCFDNQEWLIDSSICRQGVEQCWLTAGGVKFSTVTGTFLDEINNHGPMHSWGGNVNPACAPNKGHWNHIDHRGKLHFQATDIEVITCGNVPGIEPGSESPVTPVNFIEFTGPATLKGIKGNRDDFGEVCYRARAEDRNEPGSHGAQDGNDVDRYFLEVYDCNTLETLLLVDVDGDPTTVDPVSITGGNMQMHWRPCGNQSVEKGKTQRKGGKKLPPFYL